MTSVFSIQTIRPRETPSNFDRVVEIISKINSMLLNLELSDSMSFRTFFQNQQNFRWVISFLVTFDIFNLLSTRVSRFFRIFCWLRLENEHLSIYNFWERSKIPTTDSLLFVTNTHNLQITKILFHCDIFIQIS